MKKHVIFALFTAFLFFGGIVITGAVVFDNLNPTVEEICGSADNGIKKGPDADGKVSIKCFDPKGEWKYDGKEKIECKGILASYPHC